MGYHAIRASVCAASATVLYQSSTRSYNHFSIIETTCMSLAAVLKSSFRR